jgi:hypothetical protein
VKRVRDGIYEAGGIPLEFPIHPIQETGKRPTAALDRNLAYLGLVETLYGYPLDGVVLDLGVSSMQLDRAERGFSFAREGPLYMRMSQSGESAADLVNSAPEEVLADILYQYGEERASRRIARAIVAARAGARIETTLQLAAIVARCLPRPKPGQPRRPAMSARSTLHPHTKDLGGGFTVKRLLPAATRASVGPFVFFDHMGPHTFPAGEGIAVLFDEVSVLAAELLDGGHRSLGVELFAMRLACRRVVLGAFIDGVGVSCGGVGVFGHLVLPGPSRSR